MQILRFLVGCIFLFFAIYIYHSYLGIASVDGTIALVCTLIGFGALTKAEAVGSARDEIKRHEKRKHTEDKDANIK